MGRRKKEDTERLIREQKLQLDAEFKLDNELTELFIRCEKIADKFLYDNSTQEDKDQFDYPQSNKNKIVISLLKSFLKKEQWNFTGSFRGLELKDLRFADDDEFVKHLITNNEPEVMKMLEIDKSSSYNPREYPDFDMSIKSERRPEPVKWNWGKKEQKEAN